mgnify:CR=1 FL=1
MTQEALEQCLDEKVEPVLDPDKEMQIVCFVGHGETGFLDVRRCSNRYDLGGFRVSIPHGGGLYKSPLKE